MRSLKKKKKIVASSAMMRLLNTFGRITKSGNTDLYTHTHAHTHIPVMALLTT